MFTKELDSQSLRQVTLFEDAQEPNNVRTQLMLDQYRSKDQIQALADLESLTDVFSRLKQIDWSFTNEKTSYLSHDIHPYPAKFIPQIPQYLIAHLSMRGELIWDPFGGSGTTALEATLLDRRALSTDVNPLSEVIGKAKTLTLMKEDEDVLDDFLERLFILASDANVLTDTLAHHEVVIKQAIPVIPNVNDWFHPQALLELGFLHHLIATLPNHKVQCLAIVSFSKSIQRASFQDEETRYARKVREVHIGEVIKLFVGNLTAALRKVRQLAPLLRFREADFKTLDIREQVVGSGKEYPVSEGSVDLIVTSPPYPNSNDYHLYHRFRLFWLGHDPRKFGKQEIGSHLRHQREASAFESYLAEMKSALTNMWGALRPGRYAVLVLGNAIYGGQLFETATRVGGLAQDLGFQQAGLISRALHKAKRSFVSPGRRAEVEELLVLRKPPKHVRFYLSSPPYKLWPYEEVLREREVQALTGERATVTQYGELSVETTSLRLDLLRRLTFTHSLVSNDTSREPTWQAVLENGDSQELASRRKDPRYVTHGIHEYKGKFYPQLAKSLFNLAHLRLGSRILDPFCGSGTVLLESYLNGFRSFGFDMNPLAIKISRAKLAILEVDPYLRDRLIAKFLARLDRIDSSDAWLSIFHESNHAELVSWFPKPVLAKLGWLLHEVSQVPDPRVREFFEVIVSSIVRQVSQQDPRDLRIRRRAQPLTDAPVKDLFEAKLREQRLRLHHFDERSNRSPVKFERAQAVVGDSRDKKTFEIAGIGESAIDSIVTSPPYATALPYIDTDRLSILLLMGMKSADRSQLEESITGSREIRRRVKLLYEERIDCGDWSGIPSKTAQDLIIEIRQRNSHSDVGFRKQNMAALLYRYFEDMSTVMRNLHRVLVPGGSAFFVIGNSKTEAGSKVVPVQSSKVLQEFGLSLGWKVHEIIPITVTTEDRPHAGHSITENDIIWFQKMG